MSSPHYVISITPRTFHMFTCFSSQLHRAHDTTAIIHAPWGITVSAWLCRLFQTQETNPGSLTPGSLSRLCGAGEETRNLRVVTFPPGTLIIHQEVVLQRHEERCLGKQRQGQEDRQGYCMILFLERYELMSIYLRQGVNNDQSKDPIKLGG